LEVRIRELAGRHAQDAVGGYVHQERAELLDRSAKLAPSCIGFNQQRGEVLLLDLGEGCKGVRLAGAALHCLRDALS
jgi:hypothetical protein